MSKASLVCSSCNANNEPNSEFCIDCGTTLNNENMSSMSPLSDDEKFIKEYKGWKRSVPYTVASALFLTILDLIISGGELRWSYWASIPIILFAVIAPYFSYKYGR